MKQYRGKLFRLFSLNLTDGFIVEGFIHQTVLAITQQIFTARIYPVSCKELQL
jgi:hypothetical protein